MHHTTPLLPAMALLGALALAPASAAAQDQRNAEPPRYALTVLGTLGGHFSAADGLNDLGAVAGVSTLPWGRVVRALASEHGRMTDLGTLGGPDSFADENHPINDTDTVVGYSETARPDPHREDFCGLVAGINLGRARTCPPFLWQHGTMTALPTLGGTNGFAAAINNQGQAVGLAETRHHDPTCAPAAGPAPGGRAVAQGPGPGTPAVPAESRPIHRAAASRTAPGASRFPCTFPREEHFNIRIRVLVKL